jgi:hypothetical protein
MEKPVRNPPPKNPIKKSPPPPGKKPIRRPPPPMKKPVRNPPPKNPIKKSPPPPVKTPVRKPPPPTKQKRSPPPPTKRRPIVSEAGRFPGALESQKWRFTEGTTANQAYQQQQPVSAATADNFSVPVPAQAPLLSNSGIMMETPVVAVMDDVVALPMEDSL